MLPKPVIDAAETIGRFYLQKHNGNYAAAAQDLIDLRITKIEIHGNSLNITAVRIGLLVGRRGLNIDALSKFIQNELHMKVHIIEDTDCLYDHLIPRKESDY